ncbi:MAG: hypothetical protein Q9211_000392 [Gyalolechia sp. 1 TL-2023]
MAREDSAAPSTIVAEAADDFYYAFYDEAKGKLSALVANKIYNRSKSKSKNHDGVIYFFKKYQEPVHAEVGNINFENFKGASTKIRLELIQASIDISVELMQASTEKRMGMIQERQERYKNKRLASAPPDPFACLNDLGKKRKTYYVNQSR